ncbi:MAG: sel1 repeat family protein, partial [Akkermansiaceae bacterium]|nr:sel1 repeat family protein [Akkermansiaceae bacterium]
MKKRIVLPVEIFRRLAVCLAPAWVAAAGGAVLCAQDSGSIWSDVLPELGKAPESTEELKTRALGGDVQAQYDLARRYASGMGMQADMDSAVLWYGIAAEQGHAPAQFELACCYETGVGVGKNERKAAHWYRRAAEQG